MGFDLHPSVLAPQKIEAAQSWNKEGERPRFRRSDQLHREIVNPPVYIVWRIIDKGATSTYDRGINSECISAPVIRKLYREARKIIRLRRRLFVGVFTVPRSVEMVLKPSVLP